MRPQETAAVARLWHDAWHRAHAAFVPPELVALRSLDEFHLRVGALGDDLRLAGLIGAPLGLCVVRGDELDQIYVAEPAQGTGLAQALLRDGEARIAARGHAHARLFCVAQNARARAFYTRCGWVEDGFEIAFLDTAHGQGREGYPLRVCVFRKRLAV